MSDESIGTKCDESDDEETKYQVFLRTVLTVLKRFLAFLFSHVGLTSLVCGYTLLGGILFKGIELPHEELTRRDVANTKTKYIDKIVDYVNKADSYVTLNKEIWNNHVSKILREYETELYKFTKHQAWDGRFEGDDYQWSFADSLLYSATVITTIGYGNLTPKTTFGRLLTILYGIVGIPLTMLCLGNIGNLMAGCFRLLYRHACVNMTYNYVVLKRRRLRQRFMKRWSRKTKQFKDWAKRNHSIVSSLLHLSQTHVNEIIINNSEQKNNDRDSPIKEIVEETANDNQEESHRSFSKTTKLKQSLKSTEHVKSRRHSDILIKKNIGKSNAVRKHSLVSELHHQNLSTNKLFVENSFGSELQVIPENEIVQVTVEDIMKLEDNDDHDSRNDTVSSLCIDDFDDDTRMLKARLKSTRDLVPISVCLLLVTGYIILGALIFMSWEENWNFLIGFYFCFITLTTIGLGDFVPGMGRLDNDGRRVFCVIYLLLGMALLAMSFHLIQEEVRHKCRKLAVKIGLLEAKITKMLDSYGSEDKIDI